MNRLIDFLRHTPYQFYRSTRAALLKAIGRIMPEQLGSTDPTAPTDVLYGDGTWGPASGGGGITSVNGDTGPVVVLDKTDIGLANVDNTADASKSVASAATLTTPRNINGTSFNGSTDITIPTLYAADGSTSGLRTVTLGGNLVFSGNRVQATKFFGQAVGNSSSTYVMEFLDDGGTVPLFRVAENGDILWGANVSTRLASNLIKFAGTSGTIQSSISSTVAGNAISIVPGAVNNASSGTLQILTVATSAAGFQPNTGTAVMNVVAVAPIINQTGGANGITRGVYVNPTLTAAADFRAFENAVGKNVFNATSGNTLIGSATDTGEKLQVTGTTKSTKFTATAAGTSSSVYPVDILDNTATNPLLRVAEDGIINWGNSANNVLSTTLLKMSSNTVSITPTQTATNQNVAVSIHPGITKTYTSGSQTCVSVSAILNVSSGTAVMSVLTVSPNITQTGTASGITRGLWVNPTLNTPADFRAIEVAAGKIVFPLSSFADDAAAATGGIPINGLYHTSGTVKIRLS